MDAPGHPYGAPSRMPCRALFASARSPILLPSEGRPWPSGSPPVTASASLLVVSYSDSKFFTLWSGSVVVVAV